MGEVRKGERRGKKVHKLTKPGSVGEYERRERRLRAEDRAHTVGTHLTTSFSIPLAAAVVDQDLACWHSPRPYACTPLCVCPIYPPARPPPTARWQAGCACRLRLEGRIRLPQFHTCERLEEYLMLQGSKTISRKCWNVLPDASSIHSDVPRSCGARKTLHANRCPTLSSAHLAATSLS